MDNKRIKTALCFSGKLGDWAHCTDSIYENIILPLKPDIFLSTWDDENFQDFDTIESFMIQQSEEEWERVDAHKEVGYFPCLAMTIKIGICFLVIYFFHKCK